jgi:hypothetical protein
MKKILLICLVVISMIGISCNAQNSEKTDVGSSSNSDVEVYYFHYTTRCVTCTTIESEARMNVEMLYPDQVKNGRMSFTALNIEEATGKTVSEKLGVSGQNLLIVKDDKKINITTEGFLYAVAKPDKFREVMKSKIDSLMR